MTAPDGKQCESCGEGTYEIADLNDEIHCERHCNKCGQLKNRHTVLPEIGPSTYNKVIPEAPMTQTTYRVIGFGDNEHGFFNQFSYCSTIGNACLFYDAHLQNPELDGAVLIRVNHEDWEVIQEFDSEPCPHSVVCGPVGNLRVERAPKLVMI